MSIQAFPKHVDPSNLKFAQGLENRPQIAIPVFCALARWSLIDESMTLIAATCLDTDFAVVHAMLAAVVSTEARRSAIGAAVQHKLGNTPDGQLFTAVEKCVARRRKTRNRLAHWLWATSDDLPDQLVLLDPTHFKAWSSSLHEALAAAKGDTSTWSGLPNVPREGLRTLSEKGARISLRDAEKCHTWLSRFYQLLLWRDVDSTKADQLRRQLGSEDPIQEVLSTLTTKSTP